MGKDRYIESVAKKMFQIFLFVMTLKIISEIQTISHAFLPKIPVQSPYYMSMWHYCIHIYDSFYVKPFFQKTVIFTTFFLEKQFNIKTIIDMAILMPQRWVIRQLNGNFTWKNLRYSLNFRNNY